MRWILPTALLLTACSNGPQADLPMISQARSLAAEWALVNEQASQGKLTPVYVKTMRQSVREQLKTSQKALTDPQSDYGGEIAAVLREPDDAQAKDLRVHAARLKQIADGLESA